MTLTWSASCCAQATVAEALMFSAALRMAAHIPRKVRIAFVEEVRRSAPI